MPGLIQKKNDGDCRKLVWIEPFGIPVYLANEGELRIEFDCDEEAVLSVGHLSCGYLSFPAGCQVQAIVLHSGEIFTIDISVSGENSASLDAISESGLPRMIQYLRQTIRTNDDCDIAMDCIGTLG